MENIDDLKAIQIVYLNCVLMANKEIIFHGKSLGFLTDEEIKKYVFIDKKEEKMTTKEFAKLIIDTIDGEAKYGDAYTLDTIYNLCEKQLKKEKDVK